MIQCLPPLLLPLKYQLLVLAGLAGAVKTHEHVYKEHAKQEMVKVYQAQQEAKKGNN